MTRLTKTALREQIEAIFSTQADAAKRLRVSEAALSRWINGSRPVPKWLEPLLRLHEGKKA